MCKLKTQHNISYQASCTSQVIGHPPPTSLLPKSLEDSSHCSEAMFNLGLASITLAVGTVMLKDSEHHLLGSLVVALAGWFFLSQRTVTRGYKSQNWFATKVCFLAGFAPTSGHLPSSGHACAHHSSQAQLLVSVHGKGRNVAGHEFIKDALHKPVLGLT